MSSTFAKIVGHSGLVLLTFVLLSLSISAQKFTENITNKVPAHVPLKIEISDNKFGSKLEDAEIKVTNTSGRSVYFLSFHLRTPDDFPKIDGRKISVSNDFSFGSRRLSDVSLSASEVDDFMRSNESRTFKIDKADIAGFIELLKRNGINDIPRLDLIIQVVSFGDGTGFLTTGGTPYPSRDKPMISLFDNSKPFFFRPLRTI